VVKHIIARSRDESGFTLIELVMYILILSIVLGTATYFFISMRDVSVINNAAQEVKTAMQHGLNMAQSQNQRVTLNFYAAGATHPNSYSFVKEDGTSEEPAIGNSFTLDGSVYYIELQEGRADLNIAADISIVYDVQGTILNITSTGSVVVSFGGRSRTISINPNGEVTY
jgi:type II secretory pathway pseudopilin PulG